MSFGITKKMIWTIKGVSSLVLYRIGQTLRAYCNLNIVPLRRSDCPSMDSLRIWIYSLIWIESKRANIMT